MKDAKVVIIDGETVREIPCPDGNPNCELMHTAPVTDTERLNWLQAQTQGYGGWMARMSRTGRGFRLLETSEAGGKVTVREAIDVAMAREEM